MTSSTTISYPIQVKSFLEGKGFRVGDSTGEDIGEPLPLQELGILRPGTKPRVLVASFFFGLIKSRKVLPPKDRVIGVVWFSNSARHAEGQNWAVDICGENNVAALEALAEEMRTKFGVNITVQLVSRNERDAFRFADWENEPCPY